MTEKPTNTSTPDAEEAKANLAAAPGPLSDIGGSQLDAWNDRVVNDTVEALWVKNSNESTRNQQYSAAIAGLIGIAPKDELEGMMAAQLIAAHSATMECYRRAMLGQQSLEGRSENLSQANKLSRTFATLLEALNRHRGKGQQKVTVEHVHVHAGGQAIVGTIESPGGGDRRKSEEQPHAKQITYAPEPAMRSPNAPRQPMPVSGDDQRTLPDARRNVARSARRKQE